MSQILRTLVMIAIGAASAAKCCHAPALTAQNVVLEEVYAIALPDSLHPAAIYVDGLEIYLAAANSDHIVVLQPGQMRPILKGKVRSPIGIDRVGPGDLEVVEGGGRPRIKRYGTDGRLLHSWDAETTFYGVSAVRTERAWFVAGHTISGAATVLEITHQDRNERMFQPRGWDANPFLNSGSQEVIMTQIGPPFEAVSMRPDGVVDFEIPTDTFGLPFGDHWASMRIVKLRDFYLRTLADLESDHRLMILYNSDGQILRNRLLKVPIAFIKSSRDGDVVVAIRGSTHRELAVYRSDGEVLGGDVSR